MTYQSLPAAKARLDKALCALFDPIQAVINGTTYESASLYMQLVEAKGGQTGERCGGTAGMPLWPDCFDAINKIDTRLCEINQGRGFDALDRVHLIDVRKWKVEEAELVDSIAVEMESWAITIDNLLNPKSVKTISAPCPHCKATHVHKHSAGEMVRQAALQVVAEKGCTCLNCHASWPPSRYDFLRRLLGFHAPAGVMEDDTHE